VTADLDPIDPEAAVELYLDQRQDEVSESTRQTHEYRLDPFVKWCSTEGDVTNMNDLTGRDLHAYRVYRREEDDLKPVTLQGQLSTLRVFLRFCASIDAVPEGLPDKILLPTVSKGDDVSESTLEPNRAEAILAYLGKYEYGSRDHIIWLLLWRTGMRTGALRGIDLDDLDRDDPAVRIRHRPEEDTPLKNADHGERWVALTDYLVGVVEDYIDGPRVETTDEFGREPLLTTREGRASRSTIRDTFYRWTRPCMVGEECPHDREPEECEATTFDTATKCPSTRSPHDARSGAITAHLMDDVPTEIVSGRMDVSPKILNRHYDRRSGREKMEQRRDYLRD